MSKAECIAVQSHQFFIFVAVVGTDIMNDNKISPKFQDAPLISSSGSKLLVLL